MAFDFTTCNDFKSFQIFLLTTTFGERRLGEIEEIDQEDTLMHQDLSQYTPPMSLKWGYVVLRLLLGIFLLAAAALKAEGLAHDLLPQDPFFASPRLQVAAIEAEILLGLWLLSGYVLRAAWAVALAFFGLLACVSLYLALNQQESCGCFGRVTVSPWITLALDLAIITALGIWRPTQSSNRSSAAWLRGMFQTGLGAGVLLALLAGSFLLAVDNPADALARLRGESVTVEPEVCQLGEGHAGQERVFQIRLTNHTERIVRIVGGTSSCSCSAILRLPITLQPWETKAVEVRVGFQGSPGTFQHSFVLIADDEAQRIISGRFAGRVLPQAG